MGTSASGLWEATESRQYTVQFQNQSTLTARADCNQVDGTYTAENGGVNVTLSDSALPDCPPDSHGELFLELLDTATSFEMDPDGFLILSGKEGKLRLRPALAGVVWEWQDFRGGDDSLVAPRRPADYTLTFMPDGTIAIQADCVRTLGAYDTDGPILDISLDSRPQTGCQPGPLTERFLHDLGEVSSHVFRNGNLYLTLPADAGILAFTARDPAPPPATPQTESLPAKPA